MNNISPPSSSYGILFSDFPESPLDEIALQVRRTGYAILDSGLSTIELENLALVFDQIRDNYIKKYGEQRLREISEFFTIRAILTHEKGNDFKKLATNSNLLNVLKKLILGKFILNQQNGVINPPRQNYNQGSWHRDLPYQHFTTSDPIAINALFCIDDFTIENGSTFILPGTHKDSKFPSRVYIENNAIQLKAKAGQYILLDCMLYHSGGYNYSDKERRAVNHVFTIPYFKQQINLPTNLMKIELSSEEKELFGFGFEEPTTIDEYIGRRSIKK